MKKKIVLMLAVLFAAWSGIQAKTALLIVAHGSPMESWRKPVLDLEPMVKQQLANGKLKGIDLVKVALMEYTEPSVASMVKACEAEGADSIFALPIFIAPSGHTEEDLPNILGQKYNPYVRDELAEEKTEMVHTRVPIVLGPTFYYSYVLEKSMLDRIQSLSKDAANEAVIYLAHGDDERIGKIGGDRFRLGTGQTQHQLRRRLTRQHTFINGGFGGSEIQTEHLQEESAAGGGRGEDDLHKEHRTERWRHYIGDK